MTVTWTDKKGHVHYIPRDHEASLPEEHMEQYPETDMRQVQYMIDQMCVDDFYRDGKHIGPDEYGYALYEDSLSG